MHYLYSLPLEWGMLRGNAMDIGTEGRRAEGVEYAARGSWGLAAQRYIRRAASRQQRREARLHIAEHIEALEPPAREHALDAAAYRAHRAERDQEDLERYAYYARIIDEDRRGGWSSPEARRAFIYRVVEEGACHICGSHSC